MTTLRTLAHTILLITALGACATDSAAPPASTSSQLRTADQLAEHLRTTADSPLARLDPAARARFVASLEFTRQGLAGFASTELASLSIPEAREILHLFGVAHPSEPAALADTDLELAETDDATTMAIVFPNHACTSNGCKPAGGIYCTTNCRPQ